MNIMYSNYIVVLVLRNKKDQGLLRFVINDLNLYTKWYKISDAHLIAWSSGAISQSCHHFYSFEKVIWIFF